MAVVKTIKTVFQFRRGTTAEWKLNKNVIPAAGEPCFDLDLNTLRIGNGIDTYENLEAISGVKVDIAADGSSIVLEDGVLKLAGFNAAKVGAQPRKNADGNIEWVVPSTETVEGLQATVAGLQSDVDKMQASVSELREIVMPSGEPGSGTLLDRIESLEKEDVDAKIDAKINDFATKVSGDGVVNTIKELVDYVADHGNTASAIVKDIADLKELVGLSPVANQISDAIANSGHMSKSEAAATLLSKVEAKTTLQHVKYEISHKPVGTLVDYRDKEIRVMVPAGHKWEKQNVGGTGNANMYYMGFKAYAPEGAVSFKEGDRGVIIDKMFDFNDDFAGTDDFGRNYSICWLALASYDNNSDTWTYFGKNSAFKKYIGWDYCVEWYDANGIVISSDCIRINLSNETCHNIIEPYYMANAVKKVAVNGTLLDMIDGRVDITIPESSMPVKSSDEIDVAEDGTLTIKSVKFSKIETDETDFIIMDGGGAV